MQVGCELVEPSSGSSWWHLEAVAVTAVPSGRTTWFYGGRAFSVGAGLEAELHGSETDPRLRLAEYQVCQACARPRLLPVTWGGGEPTARGATWTPH